MNIKPASPKPCKAKGCRETFIPKRSFEKWCSPACAWKIAKEKLAKKKAIEAKIQRQKDRKALEAIKPRSFWENRAEEQVNRYVRLAATNDGCFTCSKQANWWGQWHASHFRSVGAASGVRYNLWNIRKACSQCNNYLSGNVAVFEPRLRAQIGDERVDWLKAQNKPHTYSVEYLKRLRDVFKKKADRQQRRNDNRL